MDVKEVMQLSVQLTNRIAAVNGWNELGERTLALKALLTCYEPLLKIHTILTNGSPPS